MEEIYITLYCLVILWINISYLKDYKNIKSGLSEISSEYDLDLNPNAISWIAIALLFNFFRSWLLYLFAVVLTGNFLVLVISIILFVIGLYDSLFNYSLAKVKKSTIRLYLAIIDSIFITIFVIYLFVF